ncbi:maltokinase N-terminal cap-like domain-containing protein [Roseivirga pacifica]|uniref:maltokinase N-terminal cap-like domain-containing protein n=1 Tax=Roseivirga pacifica TaxID=1267423 RepID=UPI003BAB66A5
MAPANQKIKTWDETFNDESFRQGFVERILLNYMMTTRWYAAKTQKVKTIKIEQQMPFEMEGDETVYFITIEANFEAGFTEYYFIMVGLVDEDVEVDKKAVIYNLSANGVKGQVIDSLYYEPFRKALYNQILSQKPLSDDSNKLLFDRGRALRSSPAYENSRVLGFDQSNTSIEYNGQYFFKVYRRLFSDANPDLELTKFLSEEGHFNNSPRYGGSVSWVKNDFQTISLCIMQEKIENIGEAWNHTVDMIKGYFERIEATDAPIDDIQDVPSFAFVSPEELKSDFRLLIADDVLTKVEKMAQRVAEMHIALFSNRVETQFNPIPFNGDYTVWLKNRIIYQLNARFILVDENIEKLTGLAQEYAQLFVNHRADITNRFLAFEENRLNSCRIRIHGDLHLGQILMTEDDDFYIIDYEGEPESTIRDRKVKQTPLKDVAGMLRSFHYAVYAVIFDKNNKFQLSQEALFEAGEKYYRAIAAVFLNKYVTTAMSENLDIGYESEIKYLLKYHLLEKAVYEIGYELKSRPDWVIIPLTGIKQIFED